MNRGSGLLVHITSLKDEFGYGCFSKEAYSFVDFLKKTNQKYWQILPLNPIDEYGSPYNNSSPYAIEPTLICLDEFLSREEQKEKGLEDKLTLDEYKDIKMEILREIFKKQTKTSKQIAFERKNKFWLDNYAKYMALEEKLHCKYEYFPKAYKNKNSELTKKLLARATKSIEFYKFLQFVAFSQWGKIKTYANKNGISIIGDMPFYPSMNSDVVWAEPENFQITDCKLDFVSGVPADYFNSEGQIWNNPVYNVAKIKEDDYKFVVKKFKHACALYDYLRIDHFRGYENFFKIPANDLNAKKGKWEKGLGYAFFKKLKEEGVENLIAEDLGQIDEKVVKLKEKVGFPGMKVYQFAFDGDAKNVHLPENFEKNAIAYLGTHDNNTFCGFLETECENAKDLVLKNLNLYENSTNEQICYSAIDKLLSSNANVVILMPQDLLCQDGKSRINKPGTIKNNWKYKLPKKFYGDTIVNYLQHTTMLYNR